MSKALLQRNTRYLLAWVPVVLLLCSVAFYVLLRMQARHMQEKQLFLKQCNVWVTFFRKGGNIEKHIVGEYDITETVGALVKNEESQDTSIYYADQNKTLPFEMLKGNFAWNNKNYQVTTYVSSTEIAHLIIKVFIAELIILLLLLIAIVFLNRKSSNFLWKPFFSTLQQLHGYDIKENQQINLLQETGTSEFDHLNKTLTNLIINSNASWQQQKQFVENASHEIQTPLAIIRSKLELLIDQPNLTEKQASLLGDITDANERLSQMNRTLLLLAKIENNQFPEVGEVNVSSLIDQVIDNYKNHYENFPELVTAIETNTTITANRSLIEIMISNLIKNAIIHNLKEGKISIGLNKSRLVIENTGTPLDMKADELFDRFKKGSHDTKTTGLGLAIVKQICNFYQYPVNYQYEKGLHRITVSFE